MPASVHRGERSRTRRSTSEAAKAEAVRTGSVVLSETNPIFSKTLAPGHELFRSPSSVSVGKSEAAAADIARAFVGLDALQRQQRL